MKKNLFLAGLLTVSFLILPAATRAASVELSWEQGGTVVPYQYVIERRTGTTGEFVNAVTLPGTVRTWVNADLADATLYQWVSYARYTNGISGPSTVVTLTTPAPQHVLAIPKNVQGISVP